MVIQNQLHHIMKKILVPIDFSENSKNALRVAAGIALKSGAALEMLHVNLAAIYSAPLSEYVAAPTIILEDEKYAAEAAEELEKLKTAQFSSGEFKNVKVTARISDGFLHSTVKSVCEDDDIDLVVMGTTGSSGLGEFLLGSNTEKVIRTSPCPILAVPEKTKEFNPKVILLPSTLKPEQKGVFSYLAYWDNLYDFIVKVLYLNNPAWKPTEGSAEAEKNRLAEAAGLKKTDTIITHPAIYEDNSVLATADQCNADLIVMGTHQRKGLSHFLFGSITEDTVNHSDIPVLAVPLS